MEAAQVVAQALKRLEIVVEESVTGLSPDQLSEQIHPESNPIGWLCWHLTRIQDDHVSNLAEKEQTWIADGWHSKFNMPADPSDYGTGDSIEKVRSFKAPNAEILLGYYKAVSAKTQTFLKALTPKQMEIPVKDDRWLPPPSVGVRLVSIIGDNTQHVGQIAFLRGLMSGFGWREQSGKAPAGLE